ncbi:matrilin-3-like [Babylonia areolata]|uniref:matrilin-3-like n=1 Tax=Babylonia areolata TaxID=304850 RepID=UPI003FCF7A8B
MQNFARQIIFHSDMDSGHQRMALLSFSYDVQVGFHLKDYGSRTEAYWAVDRLRYRAGSTNMVGLIKTLRKEVFSSVKGDRPEASNVVVLITDGEFRVRKHGITRQAELLRTKGTQIYIISIGVADTTALLTIASPPAHQNVFNLTSYSQLNEDLREQLNFCNQNTIRKGINVLTPPSAGNL